MIPARRSRVWPYATAACFRTTYFLSSNPMYPVSPDDAPPPSRGDDHCEATAGEPRAVRTCLRWRGGFPAYGNTDSSRCRTTPSQYAQQKAVLEKQEVQLETIGYALQSAVERHDSDSRASSTHGGTAKCGTCISCTPLHA